MCSVAHASQKCCLLRCPGCPDSPSPAEACRLGPHLRCCNMCAAANQLASMLLPAPTDPCRSKQHLNKVARQLVAIAEGSKRQKVEGGS